jgi:hypothetical protein
MLVDIQSHTDNPAFSAVNSAQQCQNAQQVPFLSTTPVPQCNH